MASGGLVVTAAWIFIAVVDPGRVGYAEPWWVPSNLALSLGALAIALGLPGLHALQAARTGVPGLVGMALLFVGMVLAYVGVQSVEALSRPDVPPRIAQLAAIAAPTFFVGAVITSIVTWRAGVVPRAVALALFVAVMLGLLTRLVAMPPWLVYAIPATYGAAMAWLGVEVARLARPRTPQRG
jgi:hypothetical protein